MHEISDHALHPPARKLGKSVGTPAFSGHILKNMYMAFSSRGKGFMDEDSPEALPADTTRIGPNDHSLLEAFLAPMQVGVGEADAKTENETHETVNIFWGVVVRKKKFSRSLVFFDLSALDSARDRAPDSPKATHNGSAILMTYDGRGEVRLSGHGGRVLECMVRVSLVVPRQEASVMSDMVQLGAVLEVCGVPLWSEGKRHLTVHCRVIRPLPTSASLAMPAPLQYPSSMPEDTIPAPSSPSVPPAPTSATVLSVSSAQPHAEPSPVMQQDRPEAGPAPCHDAAHAITMTRGSCSLGDGGAEVDSGLSDLRVPTPSESSPGQGGGVGRVCRHWLNHNGRCQKEESHGQCEWLHPPLCQLPALRTAWVRERRRERALASHLPDDVHPPTDKRLKTARAKMFADWLVATFGKEYLCSGSGALDIAGGHGDVSSCLWLQHGVPCTIIDPRDIRMRKWTYKALRKQEASIQGLRRFRGYLTAQGAVPEASVGQSDGREGEAGMSEEEGRRLVQNCSVLLGMHPDQATDAIIEVAWQHRKPFAIVPCCIFARDFQHRRTQRGSVVSTYEELIEYLCTQPCISPQGVQRHFLPFLGRNQVLFCTPTAPEEA